MSLLHNNTWDDDDVVYDNSLDDDDDDDDAWQDEHDDAAEEFTFGGIDDADDDELAEPEYDVVSTPVASSSGHADVHPPSNYYSAVPHGLNLQNLQSEASSSRQVYSPASPPSASFIPSPPAPPPAHAQVQPPPYYPNMTMCIICGVKPPYSKNGKSYPTCGFTCAAKLEAARDSLANSPPSTPSVNRAGRGGGRGGYSGGGSGGVYSPQPIRQQTQPVAGPSNVLSPPPPSRAVPNPNLQHLAAHLGHSPSTHSVNNANPPSLSRRAFGGRGGRPRYIAGRAPTASTSTSTSSGFVNVPNGNSNTYAVGPPPPPPVTGDPCVVCKRKVCADNRYVTCGLTCAEALCTKGGDPKMCDYCHRRPREPGYNQCGAKCRDAAKIACLLCKTRPKFKSYHLCGRSCKKISTKSTPLILEAPKGHATYEMVEKKFAAAWKQNNPLPLQPIKKIFKIIENKSFLMPYDRYKKSVGNEVFRYHGTSRKCTLGSNGNTKLCNDSGCALCSILKTSFRVALANKAGAFGAGVYASSASNKAFSYSAQGSGAVLLTKVVLGKPYPVNAFGQVSSCPAGYNSVVFDRNNGALNETIVYSDDAIRPVFLIMFK